MFFFGGLLFIGYLIRLWLSAFGGIHPDEAYYWSWSLHPALGYFDHPPMIAWMIALGEGIANRIIPESLVRVSPEFWAHIKMRAVPYFFASVLTPLMLGRCIEAVQRRPLRVLQMFALMTLPVLLFGPSLVTPDTAFFFAWSACLYLCLRLQRSRKLDSQPGDPTPFRPVLAARLGLALAFAAYSKYSAILAAFLIVLCGAGLGNAALAAAISLVLVSPHLLWNLHVAREQGGGIFFQFANGAGSLDGPSHYNRVGDMWLAEMFLWTPPIFVGAFLVMAHKLRKIFVNQKRSLLAGTLFFWALVPLLFFSLTGLRRPPEANWPLVGLFGAAVLVLARFSRKPTALLFLIAINVASIVTGIFFLTNGPAAARLVEPFSRRLAEELEKPSRLNEFTDWDQFHTLSWGATRSKSLPVEVEGYQVLSELLFYDRLAAPDERFGERLKIWLEGSRRSQFNTRPEFMPARPQGPHWLVARSSAPPECRLTQSFFKSARDEKAFNVYLCSDAGH